MTEREICLECDYCPINEPCKKRDKCNAIKLLKENQILKEKIAELEAKIRSDEYWNRY